LPNAEFQQQTDVGIYLVIQILEITNKFINTMAAIASHLHGPVPLAINELPVICTLSKVPVLVKKFPPDSN